MSYFPWTLNVERVRQCFSCQTALTQIFISCQECTDLYICTSCFSEGQEGLGHLNNHPYRVIRDDFHLFDNWTARDEILLLDQLMYHGPSNWTEVGKAMKFSSTECEKHYADNYLEYPIEALPRLPSPEQLYRPLPMVYKTGINELVRPVPGTPFHHYMGGYCAARGDFQREMFQYSETDVASINELTDEEDDGLTEALALAVVEIYNNKLKERFRRKRIVQEHGLINIHRHLAMVMNRYGTTLTNEGCARLSVFAQILKYDEFAKLFESLHRQIELKQKIRELQKCRHLGLRTFHAEKLHKRLQKQRDKRIKHLKQFTVNLNTSLSMQLPSSNIMMPISNLTSQRKSAPPLDIVGQQGYDKLTDGERKLCSISRIIPISYLEFKQILINECMNKKGIRLAQARTLIKIDVNKTRKIFDYLLQEKLIYPPG